MGPQTRTNRRRASRAALPVLASVGVLLAAAPAGASAAQAAPTFVHSAESGTFEGSRLTLRGHGIGRRVSWVHDSGRSGLVSVARMHRRLFGRRTLPVTAVLNVVGRRPGRDLAFRLSRPRRSASRHWVSYRIRRMTTRAGRRPTASALQAAVPRRFGPASLSIVGAPFGASCWGQVINVTQSALQVASATKWDTDTWADEPTIGHSIRGDTGVFDWESDGGFFRGCSNTVVFQLAFAPSATFTITTSATWDPFLPPTDECTPPPGYWCNEEVAYASSWTLGKS